MHVATLILSKPIHWLVSANDPPQVPLQQLPGWAVVHPLTPLQPTKPINDFPTGDGRWIVSRPTLHCVIPEAVASSDKNRTEGMTFDEVCPGLPALKRLLLRLRHVSRQADLPRGDDLSGYFVQEPVELPPIDFGEPYFGKVGFGDESRLETALTLEMVAAAGELPIDFEPPVYEGVLLDACKAVKEHDWRTALFYTALAIEAVAGTVLDDEHEKLLGAATVPPQIRVITSQDGSTRGDREDPVYKYLRRNGRFEHLLHEMPLYVLGKSLKLDKPDVCKLARKLYQTRNSLAHSGEPSKDKDLLPLTLEGAVDALKCATEVFAWFGVPGKWPIPFETAVDHWRSKQAEPGK